MTTYKQRIERDGFCVIEQVIPKAVVEKICAELAAEVERNHRHSEAKLAEIRRRGHRIGTPGVAQFKQVINQVQSFAPYLADSRAHRGRSSLFSGLGRGFPAPTAWSIIQVMRGAIGTPIGLTIQPTPRTSLRRTQTRFCTFRLSGC